MPGKQIQALCHGKVIATGLPHQQPITSDSRCKPCSPSTASGTATKCLYRRRDNPIAQNGVDLHLPIAFYPCA